LKKKSWEKGVWFWEVLEGVFGKEMVLEAKELGEKKVWSELGASWCYMNKKIGKGKMAERRLKDSSPEWVPLGTIGRMVLSAETFEKCCKEREEMVEVNVEAREEIAERLNSYKHSCEIDRMFEWFLENGFGVICDKEPNTGVYVKVKPDGSKLQIISDRSVANKYDRVCPLSFRLFSAEKMKEILRSGKDVWFCSFDISNFFHSFVIPDAMKRAVPTIYRWVKKDGSIVCVEAHRLVFGSSFSPVVSNAGACEIMGIADSVYDKSCGGPRSKTHEETGSVEDLSGLYVDDFLEASTVKGRGRERHNFKMGKFLEHNCGIKPTSVVEDEQEIDYAGKSYCGRRECARIGNSRKNKVKCIALLIWVVTHSLSKEVVESLVGSLCYLGCHLGWCFPFLNRASEWYHGKEGIDGDDIRYDLTVGLVLSVVPWTPRMQIRWVKGNTDPKRCIYVDAQNDFGRFGLVWWDGVKWCKRSMSIPSKFCCSQQCAELYGLKKAIGFGKNVLGREFTVASDSVGSVHALCRFKMASNAWRRNQLFRMMIRDLFGEELMIWLLWVPSEWNPADGGSREEHEERCVEGVYEGCMKDVFENCIGRTEFYSRIGSGGFEGEHDAGV
jgi:hypothetical protein